MDANQNFPGYSSEAVFLAEAIRAVTQYDGNILAAGCSSFFGGNAFAVPGNAKSGGNFAGISQNDGNAFGDADFGGSSRIGR